MGIRSMAGLRTLWILAVGAGLAGVLPVGAKPVFNSSLLEGHGSEIFFCDLDGDGLKDVVMKDGLNVSIFYQDPKTGFPRKPQLQYRLDARPCLLWAARAGTKAESLLMMTSEGVTELCFTNRAGPVERHRIIEQETIIPALMDEPKAMYFPLTAETHEGSSLLLLPVRDGLQVWSRSGAEASPAVDHAANAKDPGPWYQVQFIENTVNTQIQPVVTNSGYAQSFGINLSLGDVNGDGRDDLMVVRNLPGDLQVYALYLQNADDRFTTAPVLVYTNKPEWGTSLCWSDINRDGKVDLIKSSYSDEPFFVPGIRSGKVYVGTYFADELGRIPAKPQQVFRKNDWSSSLPMVDVDGDGFPDLVLGYIPIDTREGARKLIVSEAANLNLKFHFYRPGIGFSKEPDYQRDTVIHFHQGFFGTPEQRMYYEMFVSLNGDFNGDGKKDLLIRDRGDAISVYFFISREKGFSPKADFTFGCVEPIDWWEIQDLNGDGLSDLVVKLRGQDLFRVFISGGRQ
jgi:hypothetical protein